MRYTTLILAALLLFSACAEEKGLNPWSRVKTPSAGPARSIGGYASGCVAGAEALALEGDGYRVMRPERGRYYGHPQLVRYVEELGRHTARTGNTMLVGDLGQPRGGPIPGTHASHQTGLDVDIWYAYLKPGARLSAADRETLFATSLVREDGRTLQDWKAYYVALLKAAAAPPEVERIFVHPAIKRGLCEAAKGSAWLRKIRPWWGHDDHFHARLQCPAGEKNCRKQYGAIPAGDGCDGSLDWWFSPEAIKEAKARKRASGKTKATFTGRLPKLCHALLP